jgi:hypothetical protein
LVVDDEDDMAVLSGDLAVAVRRAHGVVSRSALLEAGVSRHQIQWALETGELIAVHRGVYQASAAPASWPQRVLRAVLAAGPGALASHRSAAALWELDGSTQGVPEVVTSRHLRSWAIDLGRRHESKDLHLAQPAVRLGIPCTGLTRTLVDLGAVQPLEIVRQAVDDAIRRRLCTWEDVTHTLAMHSKRGRNGVGTLRQIVEAHLGTAIPDSHFNRIVERLLVGSGLEPPVVEHVVRDAHGAELARLDLAYPPEKVGIELDSRKHHLTDVAFEHDRLRQNRLELAGWLILRYTWLHYTRTPNQLVNDVAVALRTRRAT